MRAKFYCDSVEDDDYGQNVKLSAVYSGTPEDNQFSEATPAGELTMTISNENAKGFLKVGKKYYLDFSEAPDED